MHAGLIAATPAPSRSPDGGRPARRHALAIV